MELFVHHKVSLAVQHRSMLNRNVSENLRQDLTHGFDLKGMRKCKFNCFHLYESVRSRKANSKYQINLTSIPILQKATEAGLYDRGSIFAKQARFLRPGNLVPPHVKQSRQLSSRAAPGVLERADPKNRHTRRLTLLRSCGRNRCSWWTGCSYQAADRQWTKYKPKKAYLARAARTRGQESTVRISGSN